MSTYTSEVRFICENYAGLSDSEGYSNVAEIIESARSKVFDFDFPIFDENYRATLETKILKHYYTREIGLETVGLWKLKLDTKMNEIMPYYNQLYKSAVLEFNPLYDVDLTTDYQKVDNGNNDKTSEFSETGSTGETGEGSDNSSTDDVRKNDHWDYYSATPQGGIEGVQTMTYLTDARHITDDGTGSTSETERSNSYERNVNDERNGSSSSNEVIKNVEDYLNHVKGKSAGASYSKLLSEYRETFLNIDMMIIDDLSDLFMNVY